MATTRLFFSVALSTAAFLMGAHPVSAQNTAAAPGGMTVHVDPQTGALRAEPTPGSQPLHLTPKDANAASTSSQGLAVVPNDKPGGGQKIDLQGRFRSPLIGTVDANGKFRMQHPPAPTPDGTAK